MAQNHQCESHWIDVFPSCRTSEYLGWRLDCEYLFYPRSNGYLFPPSRFPKSSLNDDPGFAGSAAYVATKHGVIGLTRSTAKENGHRNVRVNAIAPGSIQTPLLDQAHAATPDKGTVIESAINRLGTAEEMANIIAFLLGPESSYVTGSVYGADGGWNC